MPLAENQNAEVFKRVADEVQECVELAPAVARSSNHTLLTGPRKAGKRPKSNNTRKEKGVKKMVNKTINEISNVNKTAMPKSKKRKTYVVAKSSKTSNTNDKGTRNADVAANRGLLDGNCAEEPTTHKRS